MRLLVRKLSKVSNSTGNRGTEDHRAYIAQRNDLAQSKIEPQVLIYNRSSIFQQVLFTFVLLFPLLGENRPRISCRVPTTRLAQTHDFIFTNIISLMLSRSGGSINKLGSKDEG